MPPRFRPFPSLPALLLIGGVALVSAQSARAASPGAVGALGRIEPKDGVRNVSGPSEVVLVLADVLVEEGDPVKKGQVIAHLDDFAAKEAAVERQRANLGSQEATVIRLGAVLANARLELARNDKLQADGLLSIQQRDQIRLSAETASASLDAARQDVKVAVATLRQADVDLERRVIRSPLTGHVLRIFARAGEKVGSDGIAQLAQTADMYAVAEVYETDISKVKIGSRATVKSPVLPKELTGKVERIAWKIGRKSVLNDDPSAKRDVRVVEVRVRLDDSATAAPFTFLQVEVRFEP